MFIQPRLAEDDVMGNGSNVQTNRFFVFSDLENNGIEVGDEIFLGIFVIHKD